jgi:hypothetical protein
MGAPYPVLYNGMGSSQGIWDVVTDPVHLIGTRGALQDGRVFYYARNSGAALVAGNLLQSEGASVDLDDQVTGTHAVGEKTINLTSVGTKTMDANDLAEGYFHDQQSTASGSGPLYKISTSSAITAAAAYTITLYDGLVVALAAAAKGTVAKNPWMDTVILAANRAFFCCGAVQVAVGSGATTKQYFWCQTWGMACVTADSASALGDALMGGATAGQTVIATAGDQVVGTAYTLGVDGAWVQCFLQIAP